MNGAHAGGIATILVNDEPRPFSPGASLAHLAEDLRLGDRKGVAIAVNGAVVPRGSWPARILAGGDRVLVIRATQGG